MPLQYPILAQKPSCGAAIEELVSVHALDHWKPPALASRAPKLGWASGQPDDLRTTTIEGRTEAIHADFKGLPESRISQDITMTDKAKAVLNP
jgi:hypothetical protein